jgi:fibronectin-binding autotransporter adhesin
MKTQNASLYPDQNSTLDSLSEIQRRNLGNTNSSTRRLVWKLGAIVAGILLASVSSHAAMLTWDAGNTNNGATIDPADGTWDTTVDNLVWNNGSANVPWTQTSPTVALNGALFGGADGTYAVTVGTQVAVTNLTFNNSGYTLSGSAGVDLAANSTINVAANKTATINCNLPIGNSGVFWNVGANGSLTFNGNTGGQPRFLGPGTYWLGGVNNPSVPYFLAPVYITNGTFTASASFFIAYNQTVNGVNYNTGSLVIDGPTTVVNHTSGDTLIARAGATGSYTIRNGATHNTGITGTTTRSFRLALDNNANNHATLDVQDGALNVGNGSLPGQITFGASGSPTGQTAVMTQEGGTVTTYGGLMFGGTTGSTGGTASYTMSGGSLYLGAGGVAQGSIHPNVTITLSGGTVGALASWSSALPMTLATINGDTTFQCADSSGNSFNISLPMALTGSGGLKKSGTGTLTLSGANTYTGTTVSSNGTLVINTANLPTNGPVTLEGAAAPAGYPINSMVVPNPGQYWSIGNLTYDTGTPTADFAFGSFTPSTTVAPIQVNGNVAFNVTPLVTVEGSAIVSGTYPLIKYIGTLSGTLPTSLVTLPAGATSASIVNNPSRKTIDLVVSSTISPALTWAVGNGVWNTTTPNWKQFGSSALYTDGDAVVFDDSASGPFPIPITINSTVNPYSVTANNSVGHDFTIPGTGAIAGGASLEKDNTGTLTLSGTNTYVGGTTVNAGQLNINNGGDPATGTAIGTGPLTINPGATLDNTSGADVTLNQSILEYWNGSFNFLGSSNNLNTGAGGITMNANVTLAVNSNTFTAGGSITDNGLNYTLTKTGNGALTLPVANTMGGITLSAGLLNLGDPSSVGSGTFTIFGGSIDNISGQDLTLAPTTINFFGSGFTFVGTANLDLGAGTINGSGGATVINVLSNTLTFEGALQMGNGALTKNGKGTLALNGTVGNRNGPPVVINEGQVNFGNSFGNVAGGNPAGVTVNTNGLLVITGLSGDQISDSATPVRLVGGVFDLNGNSEGVFMLTITNGGTLRNGAASTTSTLTLTSTNVLTLANANSFFDVPAPDAFLGVSGYIAGIGSLVKTGAGSLILYSNNIYTGNTTISAGTLALSEPGSISNSSVLNIVGGATLDVTARADQTLTLNAGQILMGDGSLNGNLVTLPGSTVSPGESVGTLRVTNNITLGGNLLLELNRTNTPSSDQLPSALGTITYGGTLSVTNIGPALQAGDSFQLFPSSVTAFTAISLASTDANGKLYTWNNKVAVDGSIQVLTVQNAVNTTPTNITFSVVGNSLKLSWPSDHLGWTLKTNAVGLTDTNAWFPYPGSAQLTNVTITIDPAKTNVYFQLVYP